MLFPFSEKRYELFANRGEKNSRMDAYEKNGFNSGGLLWSLWKYAAGSVATSVLQNALQNHIDDVEAWIFLNSKANGIYRDGIREVGPLTCNSEKRPFHVCSLIVLGHVDPAPCDPDNRQRYPLHNSWHGGTMCPNDITNHPEKASIGRPQQKHAQLHHRWHKWSPWIPKVKFVYHIQNSVFPQPKALAETLVTKCLQWV